MIEIMRMLVGADFAMAAVSVVLVILTIAAVQGVKRLLPAPVPAGIDAPVDKWAVADWLSWVPFLMAFVFGMVLYLLFGPIRSPVLSRIWLGIQTGAAAVAMWEGYSQILKPIIEKIRA